MQHGITWSWRMCIHCVQVSLNPMTGVIIYLSVKRFERAFGLEKCYIRTSYYYYYLSRISPSWIIFWDQTMQSMCYLQFLSQIMHKSTYLFFVGPTRINLCRANCMIESVLLANQSWITCNRRSSQYWHHHTLDD